MYSIPKFAFGKFKENTTKHIRIIANKGIIVLFANSIPFLTPRAVKNIQIVKNANVKIQVNVASFVKTEK